MAGSWQVGYVYFMVRALLADAWAPQFGQVDVQGSGVVSLSPTSRVGSQFHAEAHYFGVLCSDFLYSAVLAGDWADRGLCADLQFWISDEGRYGVRVQNGRVSLYRFALVDRPCADDPAVISQCPGWGGDDPLVFQAIGPTGDFDPGVGPLRVTVEAAGTRLSVSYGVGDTELGRFQGSGDSPSGGGLPSIGRFGVYAISDKNSSSPVVFSDLQATTDPTADSNFALLYSTPGYDVQGTKRLLVRTINDIDPPDIVLAECSFTVSDTCGNQKIARRSLSSPGGQVLGRAFGMQVLEGDFTDLRETGTFVLDASIATSGGTRELRSQPFEIRSRLVSEAMLWPMATLNARARRAADDDFRRNWRIESSPACWSVGLDGVFVADRADDQAGATLRRVLNIGNGPLSAKEFRFVCRITIIRGCDAQMQFWVSETERWAVTLQAGSAGDCAHGSGPGAVRLHREGTAVNQPNQFEVLQSYLLDAKPFEVGRAYDVEVLTEGSRVRVLLDGLPVIDYTSPAPPPGGGFALKAWASSARFGHAKVWDRYTALSRPMPGVWIPYNPSTGMSSQQFPITVLDQETLPGPAHPHDVFYPFAAQQHGFHDCNNYIGEVTSHGMFLAALMAVWQSRASEASAADQDSLREAILTGVLYLNELYEQGNRSGAFTHQEPGRGAFETDDHPDKVLQYHALNTQFAIYGLSAFAAAGLAVDGPQARKAFDLAVHGWNWLGDNGVRDIGVDSVVAIRLALAAQRQGRPADDWFAQAVHNTKQVLATFSVPGTMANMPRPTLRSISWFEGVYETLTSGRLAADTDQLAAIATQLEALLNNPANAFQVIPQWNYSPPQDPPPPPQKDPAHNWNDMADLPYAVYPIPDPPVGDWYVTTHFLTAAADCVYIGRLARVETLERLGTGNLYWALGLNPGVPTSKVAGPPPDPRPWRAASLVHNGPGAFVRTIEGWRTQGSSAKTWLAAWEEPAASPHRETWWFDPADTGFQTVVNGHVLREGQWHYWSTGEAGWVSGETFLLNDGIFLRAALALEDWRAQQAAATLNPYNLSGLRFFDTTHLDRAGTQWQFDDPDSTGWAQAQRMTTDFAAGKGFGGGRLTGHYAGERVGLLCLPATATSFADIPDDEITATLFPFDDINTAPWTQIGRAAVEIAIQRGFATGYFTGHQVPGKRGLIGIKGNLVSVFDILYTDPDVAGSEYHFSDIDAAPWAQAARLATNLCTKRGFAGGFFTGNHLSDRCQVVAFHQA
jgi:hypothetical protein